MILLLGLADIGATIVLILRVYKVELSPTALIVAGIYLLAKVFIFPINLPAFMDFTAGILILLSFFIALPQVFSIIIIILMLFKGFRSFSSSSPSH